MLAARTRFDPARHWRLTVEGRQVGWLPHAHADTLRAMRIGTDVLGTPEKGAVALLPALDTAAARSGALARVAAELARQGALRGWRDEFFAVTDSLDAEPLAMMERAAARYLGLLTFASHLNGIATADGDSDAPAEPMLWIARRSHSKAVDPGLWDNLVAGGMPHGSDPLATLVRECEEESGIPPALAAHAQPHGFVEVLREIDEGVQWEQVFVFDLQVPADFVPVNRDGEVAEHRRIGLAPLLAIMADGAMTLDATLATLDALRRRGWIPARHCRIGN
ncbi:Isopentenyldiphosphate isomerase [Cupriavidus gilardii J11]|uniref:Isopentenyldiphosphate isomerase n=1 Tax=Cupriavidus gilardii J11 TaxID=936133 RepID=A0A562BND4_9BURK|nr:Isopentenyldiphosphate isomerase [Cupriavidus gilardii J11]